MLHFYVTVAMLITVKNLHLSQARYYVILRKLSRDICIKLIFVLKRKYFLLFQNILLMICFQNLLN